MVIRLLATVIIKQYRETLIYHRFINNIITSAANRSIGSTTGCTITEKAPTRAFSWLKAATTAFTFKTLLRHYAKRALTPQSLNVKLGPQRKGHRSKVKGTGGSVSIVSYSRPSLMIVGSSRFQPGEGP